MTDSIAKSARRVWPRRGLLVLLLILCTGLVQARGPVFEITRGGAPAGYLVGTMHSEDPRVTALVAELAPLIGAVDVVAVELVPDAVALLAVGAATLLSGEQRLRHLVGAARFAALRRTAAERDIPVALLDRLKPWAAAVVLGMPATGSGRVLDMEIYLEALEQDRRVVGLETVAEQIGLFDDLAPEHQLLLLDEMIKNASEMPTQLERLTLAYLDGDLERLDRVAAEQYRAMPTVIRDWFEQELVVRRNRRMLERAAGLLADNRVLIAVGAMHLGGDSGLVAGLRGLGFSVEAVDGRGGRDGSGRNW